jgi:hypothetical protein
MVRGITVRPGTCPVRPDIRICLLTAAPNHPVGPASNVLVDQHGIAVRAEFEFHETGVRYINIVISQCKSGFYFPDVTFCLLTPANCCLLSMVSAERLPLVHDVGSISYLSSMVSAERLPFVHGVGSISYLLSIVSAAWLPFVHGLGSISYLSSMVSAAWLPFVHDVGSISYLLSIDLGRTVTSYPFDLSPTVT